MRKINTGDVFKMARLLKNANVMDAVKDAYKASKKEDGAKEAHKEGPDKGSIWVDAAMKVHQPAGGGAVL